MSRRAPVPTPPGVALRSAAARRLGCEVQTLDPETGYLFELRDGAKARILIGGFSPLNDAMAARLAEDKFHTALVLARAGLRVPATARCLEPGRFPGEFPSLEGLAPGLELAGRIGFPLVVKPNRGARGRDVERVEDRGALAAAVERIWRWDYLALVQELVPGSDLRLDFLDGEFLFGYLREPLVVEGDGTRRLGELAADAGAALDAPIDAERLRQQGWDPDRLLERGCRLDLSRGILNLNRLCRARRLPEIAAPWQAFGRRLGEILGLRHFGVDLKIASLDQAPEDAVVLEANASPSLLQMSRTYPEAALEAEMRVVRAILA